MRRLRPPALTAALVAVAAVTAPAIGASAFCGFYVSGADASLYNDATMVVLMRNGTRTVLSMQNNYQGPPQDFAMVVPVPVVLQEENVKTLPREIFDRLDQLAAPRLVEYWEQDPCFVPPQYAEMAAPSGAVRTRRAPSRASGGDLGVTIEAQFSVAEYDIVILSANDSSGLDTWLRREQYNIPQGAEAVLRPYVAAGTKFFVAKVDVERVTFTDGRAVLSPLRFHYDSDEFNLPVRLGLLNSGGQQDLIVHILARGQRYEAANYPNVTIPTNIRVVDAVRQEFGPWYDLLFRRTVASSPGSVVTEYSWDASSCDPCPVPPLNPGEMMTLGADVIDQVAAPPGAVQPVLGGGGGAAGGMAAPPQRRVRARPPRFRGGGFVLTRLHYRYGREGLDEDLVFRAAPPIIGGRGMPDPQGNFTEEGAQPSSMNNFQGRYAILHEWEGEVSCQNPVRGRWGGPPGGAEPQPIAARNAALTGEVAAAPTIHSVGQGVAVDVPAIQVVAGQIEAALPGDPGPAGGEPAPVETGGGTTPPPGTVFRDTGPQPSAGGCASCLVAVGGSPAGGSTLFAALLLAVIVLRRRG